MRKFSLRVALAIASAAALLMAAAVQAAETVKETVETMVKNGTAAAKASYEQAMQMTKDQVEKASQNFFKGYGELAVIGKDNLEAFVQSSTAVVKGTETFGKEWMGFAQAAVEQNVAAIQSLVAAKTLKEVVDLQNDWAKKALFEWVRFRPASAPCMYRSNLAASVPLMPNSRYCA